MLGNNTDVVENRNGTASALLHIDETTGLGRLAKQKPKKRRRLESRQYQTGKHQTTLVSEVVKRKRMEMHFTGVVVKS